MYDFEFWGFKVCVSYVKNISYMSCDVNMWDWRDEFLHGVYGVVLCALYG